MSSFSSRVDVRIYGSTYSISGDVDQDYIEKLGSYVDDKMKELSAVLPGASIQKLAILAALNISDELFQLREMQGNSKVAKIYEERAKKLISMLDEGIIGDGY